MHPSVINPFQPVNISSTRCSSSLTSVQKEAPELICDEPPFKRQKQLKIFGAKAELTIKEKHDIDRSLMKLIVLDYQPLSIVENSGFLEYSKKLNPLYEPPSRKHLSSVLLTDLYNETRLKVKKMLSSVKYVSITTDLWSSDSCKAYITVTCHFIYECKLICQVLCTKEVLKKHTAENIASVLSSIFDEWEISGKIITIV